ncbi:hypothetical protein PR002_g2668 [Phytophthora rubi]|uniref:Kinesin motor domain-containing protein n=1 Tax=Phytophthora rubi TaxID=129364 RepID=A0A6A3NW31_9STRA|nr:hypothetical protein PR002_g2668 [Phytophthora rubi]
MSLAASGHSPSTSDSAPLFLLSPVALRPMTSHARIEGGALYDKSEREVADLRPIPRKNFLPHLAPKTDIDEPNAPTDEDTDSDTYRQKMWAGQANILVTVRLRPILSHDRDREEIVKVSGNKEVVVLTRSPGGLMESILSANSPVRRYSMHPLRKPRHASASPSVSSGQSTTRSREKRYAFDYVFSPRDDQQKVYQHTTKFLIHGVLNGFNATVFAYGCTGAGKTYTMFGTSEEPGIMARTLEDLFRNIERVHADPTGRVQYRVTVSFLEVYNENIRDLLSASSSCSSATSMPTSEFLDLREDPVRGSVVAGLSEVEANNAQDVMKLLRRGNKYRSQESTAANSVSSRSHAVLQVHIEQQEKITRGDSASDPEDVEDKGSENTEVKFGKLSLVDLAGMMKKSMDDQLLVSFTQEREVLIQQLARNERAMDEFRRGIEQSPLMERNELIREVLLMEYRIGHLEIDKMQLQTLRDLQSGTSPRFDGQHGNNDDPVLDPLDVRVISDSVRNDLHLDLPTLMSGSPQPQSSDRDSVRVHLPDIKPTKGTSGRGGFLEELREHLYPSKANSHRDNHQQVTAASSGSYHKHWGLHLNNAALPYIRLKKKNPVPLYVEPTGSLAAVISLGKSPSTTSVAEPYLKSLKKRHKPARAGKKHNS